MGVDDTGNPLGLESDMKTPCHECAFVGAILKYAGGEPTLHLLHLALLLCGWLPVIAAARGVLPWSMWPMVPTYL